jgi:hypothetical protein
MFYGAITEAAADVFITVVTRERRQTLCENK